MAFPVELKLQCSSLRQTAALFTVIVTVLLWVSMAELLARVQQKTTRNQPLGTFQLVWLTRVPFIFAIPVWMLLKVINKRPILETRMTPTWKDFGPSIKFYGLMTTLGIGSTYFWYLSLPIMPVSANTAIFNSSPVVVFLLSVILAGEKATLAKTGSVLLCVGGVLIVSFASIQDPNDKGDTDDEHYTPHSEAAGYVLVSLSMVMFSLLEVLYKRFDTDMTMPRLRLPVLGGGGFGGGGGAGGGDGSGSAEEVFDDDSSDSDVLIYGGYAYLSQPSNETLDSFAAAFLYHGVLGVVCTVFFWPILLILPAVGTEVFVPLDAQLWQLVFLLAFMAVLMNVLRLAAVSLSSPLFVAVGTLLTIPVSVTADWLLYRYILPGMAFLGLFQIAAGFVILNLEQAAEASAAAELNEFQTARYYSTLNAEQPLLMTGGSLVEFDD